MSSEKEAPPTFRDRPLLAPLWHTAGLIASLLIGLYLGLRSQMQHNGAPTQIADHSSALGLYLGALIMDWWLFLYVWMFSRHDTSLFAAIQSSWRQPKRLARDVVLGLLFWFGISLADHWMTRLLGPDTAKSIAGLLPQTPVEILVWILLSLTAGFCEEMVFRGYLQRQFQALTNSALAGVVVQAALFGLIHGYQGIKKMVVITTLGLLYGLMALSRRSVRPGIVAHAWADIYGGLQMQTFARFF